MLKQVSRLAGAAMAAALAAWWGRVIAHHKKPAPEGRWQEVPADEIEAKK